MKTISEFEAKLNRRFIPINLIVCALCVMAIISLLFMPVVKLNVGKILHNENTVQAVDELVEGLVGGSLEGEESGEIDFAPVVVKIIKGVFSKAEGSLKLSGISAAKVAFAPADKKAEVAKNELFFGEKALITELSNSIAEGVSSMFSSPAGHDLIEEAVVSIVIEAKIKENPAASSLSDEQIKELTEVFRGVENLQSSDTTPVSNQLISDLERMTGTPLSEADKTNIADEVKKMYDKAAQNTDGKVTFETMVCVAVSSEGLGDVNIGSLLGGLAGGGGEGSVTGVVYAEGEETPEEEAPEENAPENAPQTSEGNKPAINYDDLLAQMGYGEAEKEQLKETIRTSLMSAFDGAMQSFDPVFPYYGFLFYGMLFFAAFWFIRLLFAFFRLFAKRKSSASWYVILLGWIPGMLWFGIALSPLIVPAFFPGEGGMGRLIKGVLSGISSGLWLCAVCYIALCVLSIVTIAVKKGIKEECVQENKRLKKLKKEERARQAEMQQAYAEAEAQTQNPYEPQQPQQNPYNPYNPYNNFR